MKSKKRALLVYQDGYRARLTEALGETFEACWWVLGDDTFFALCASFVRAHPSLDYNLNSYGREFPEYLYNHKLSEEIPFLFDLASFEWSFKKLFECKQHTSLKVEEFALINDPNDMKLKFGEAFFLFSSKYSIYKVWQMRKKDQSNCFLDFDGEENLIFYKQSEKIFSNEVDSEEFSLLKNLKSGYSLAQALDVQKGELNVEKISLIFQKLVKRGLITELTASKV